MDQSGALLQSIIDTAIDGIITIDYQGIIQTINPAASELFGYNEQELIGENVKILMPKMHRSRHDQYISNYLQTGKAKIIGVGREVEGKKKDGTLFPLRLAVSKVETDNGILFTGILHDLTALRNALDQVNELNIKLKEKVMERTAELESVVNRLLRTNKKLESEIGEREKAEFKLRKSEQELKVSLEKEKELGNLKTRFMSMASHEFKTPLSTVMSSASLIERYLEKGNKDKAVSHAERIKNAVDHLNGVLNDFLSLNRLDEGKIEATMDELDLVECIENARSEMKYALKTGQRIHIEKIGETWTFQGDRRMLKNILYNLISNAIKYSEPDSGIFITLKEEVDRLIVRIRDEGIGIPSHDQKHLFSRFFRSDNVSHIPGTGLGLAIVEKYLTILGGKIEFQSEEGKGSTFIIIFEKSTV